MAGLVVFGATSAFAGSVGSAESLIVGRALMGIGAALIFPATLAILTNVFRDPGERAKAIGIWSAVSGMAVAAGPITGGWLLENFWWGSVFFINVPVTVVVALAAWRIVPESRTATRHASTGSGSRCRSPPSAPSCSRSSRRPSGAGCRPGRSSASPLRQCCWPCSSAGNCESPTRCCR